MGSETNLSQIAQAICEKKGLALDKRVGGGAFKQVFRVETEGGDSYALKIIKGTIAAQRTDREIEALKRCDHANIARLFKTGTCESHGTKYSFILEEFLSGGTLTLRYQELGPLNNEELCKLAQPLISAISHVASLDLVHRDIKPDNIMFREDRETPVLVDFNTVRNLAEVSLTQSWLNQGPGTPYFAAPEQLNNQKSLIDWRTDQFSLGVTLCCVRFGAHPYEHSGEGQLSPHTVERVATRGRRSDCILAKFEENALSCLQKMTNIWPVERYRWPTDLQVAWENIGVQ